MDPFVPLKFKQYATAALGNLSSDIDTAEIDNGLRIVARSSLPEHVQPPINFIDDTLRKLNNPDSELAIELLTKERERLVHRALHARLPIFPLPATHFLEYYSDSDTICTPEPHMYVDRLLTLFSIVTTSLRLRDATPVYISYFHGNPISLTYISPSEDIPVIYTTVVTRFITTTYPLQFHRYPLLKRHLPELRRIFRSVKSSGGPARIALNRLDQQYVSRTDEDRLLDIITGLEALYGATSPQIQRSLAQRCSKHLGESEDSYRTIYNRILRAYEIRSAIVHGVIGSLTDKKSTRLRKALRTGNWLSEQNKLQDASQDMLHYTSSLLRRGLRSFLLDTNLDHETFWKTLDDCIVTGTSYTSNPD